MVISLVAVGGKITAALMNSVIKAVNGIALNGIVPAAVTGSGGTVTVTGNGKITFVGAGTVQVDGVFSGTYDNYRITWNSTTRSAATSTQFHLRGAGTDVNSNYDFVKSVASGTTVTTSSSSSSSAVPLDQGQAVGQISNGVLDLFGPALAQATTATVQSGVVASSVLYGTTAFFAQENATSYDGFTLFPLSAGSTWSGTVCVYGYNTLT